MGPARQLGHGGTENSGLTRHRCRRREGAARPRIPKKPRILFVVPQTLFFFAWLIAYIDRSAALTNELALHSELTARCNFNSDENGFVHAN
jgi:hypothetical protein